MIGIARRSGLAEFVLTTGLALALVLLVASMPAAARQPVAPGSGGASAFDPRVVVTIKPLHALVAGIMRGRGRPILLIPADISPHRQGLMPSQARALRRARLVFRIGPDFEITLNKPIAVLATRARVVALMRAPGLRLLPARAGGVWSRAARTTPPSATTADPHIWLDPANARAMVSAIVAALADMDPSHARAYARNGAALEARLAALDRSLRQSLRSLVGRPFIVFHDAYQYFTTRYGLRAVGALTVAPGRGAGARRLARIRRRIRSSKIRCVFTEPQVTPRLARAAVAGTGARLAVLDPLGAALPTGPDAYFALLRGLVTSLRDCLGDAGN